MLSQIWAAYGTQSPFLPRLHGAHVSFIPMLDLEQPHPDGVSQVVSMWIWFHSDSFWRPITEASIPGDSRKCWAMDILHRAISTGMGGGMSGECKQGMEFPCKLLLPVSFSPVTTMLQPVSPCDSAWVANGCTTWNGYWRDYSAQEDTVVYFKPSTST